MDDIVIFSKNIEQHLEQVEEILSALHAAGLSLKFRKCRLFQDNIRYLGYIVKPGSLEIDQTLKKSIRAAKPPQLLHMSEAILVR